MSFVKHTKLSLFVLNSCLLGSLLFFSLPNQTALSQEESIIPESDLTNSGTVGDTIGSQEESVIPESDISDSSSVVGDIFSGDGDSSEGPGGITRRGVSTPEANVVAANVIAKLNTGSPSIAAVATSNASTAPPGAATVSADGTSISVEGVGGIASGLSAAIDAGGSKITIESKQTTVTLEVEPPTISLKSNSSKLAAVLSDKSFKLKADKIAQLDRELLTVRVKAVDKATLQVNSYTITGEPELVKSEAAAVTALSLGGASKANVELSRSMISDTKIQPEMLVNLMLSYQGVLGNASTEVKSESTEPAIDLVKLKNSIEAHNQIITETEPEVFEALMNNGEFELISQTLTQLRDSV